MFVVIISVVNSSLVYVGMYIIIELLYYHDIVNYWCYVYVFIVIVLLYVLIRIIDSK